MWLGATVILAADGAAQPGGTLGAGPSPFAFDPLSAAASEGPIRVTAAVERTAEGKPLVLAVTAALEPGWHLYAVDQAPGGPLATKIELDADAGWRATGPFVPDVPATRQTMGERSVWKGLVIQEHSGRITWRAPVTSAKADASGPVRGSVRVQLCRDNACTPPEAYEFTAAVPAAQAPAGTAAAERARPAPPVSAAPGPLVAAAAPGPLVAAAAPGPLVAAAAPGPLVAAAAPGPLVAAAAPGPADRLLATHVPDKGHTAIEAAFVGTEAPYRLVMRLLPEMGWHLYAPAGSATTVVGQGKPTLLSATLPDGIRLESVRAVGLHPATQAELAAAGAVEGPVELEALLVADAPLPAGAVADLRIGFQTCSDTSCDPPQAVRLTAPLPPSAGSPGIEFSDVRYAEAARGAVAIVAETAVPAAVAAVGGNASQSAATPDGGAGAEGAAGASVGALPDSLPVVAAGAAPVALSLPKALFFGLLGGLILNLMPCVLPVLGLKLLSFAQQSGRARQEVFQMNLWYCAGVFAVFFGLATASVAANLGLGSANLAWGEQFTSTTFNIVMIGIVFAFALAFLGIWELPIPGFIGEKAGHVQSQEGPVGAFLKGVLSTVLATPCSGPFLGPVFGFTLTQSTGVTYAVFGAIATGMALPYILVGLFPGLVRFLPKPGAWMNTFKELLGFVMLGTVAFFFSFLAKDWFVPTFVLMIGIWMACWWVGREQERAGVAPFSRWLQGAALAAAVGTVAFAWMAPGGHSVIEWEKPFSQARLAELRGRGATVMIDFTADWCLT